MDCEQLMRTSEKQGERIEEQGERIEVQAKKIEEQAKKIEEQAKRIDDILKQMEQVGIEFGEESGGEQHSSQGTLNIFYDK